MKLPAWLTGPKLPRLPYARNADIEDLLYLADVPVTAESYRMAAGLRDVAWGKFDRHLKITRAIVVILRREFT